MYSDKGTRGRVAAGNQPGGRAWPRRRVLKAISAVGVGSAVFGRALVSLAAEKMRLTPKMIRQAEWVSGIELDQEKRDLMLAGVNETLENFNEIRKIQIDNSVAPALYFSPDPAGRESRREPVEDARSPLASRGLFLVLDALPVPQHFVGIRRTLVAEHVRMPAYHLLDDAPDDISDREDALLLAET